MMGVFLCLRCGWEGRTVIGPAAHCLNCGHSYLRWLDWQNHMVSANGYERAKAA